MGGESRDALATLDAWRARGADRLNPVRFRFIEALARRAAAHSGDARHILDGRLAKLLEAYAGDLESAGCKDGKSGDVGGTALPGAPPRGPLAGLVNYLAIPAPSDRGAPPAAIAGMPRRASLPDMEVLGYFRDTWSRVSTDRRLRQSLEQVPDNAGPLNSSRLVHRSLCLMRELSPEYLHQFLSYVDALSWMEQMNGGGAMAGKDAPRAGSIKPSARGRPR
ncbi:DUF2894 domain-containing protein [Cupriavidus basilensis]|uniref:DUF2894 domain-containing protein n=1 Tax=Cupriavidus basilensis TaxID=68895 RepID=UPI0005BAEC9E|nr:DUF2894 domain-containing protein [Cupriavidus basilensis]